MGKLKKVEIDLKLLERIAEYYEFPLAVFFGNEKCFTTKRRGDFLIVRAKEFQEKLNALVEEYYGD